MSLLLNWVFPICIGLAGISAGVWVGLIIEAARHECPSCPRKHRDEL